MDFERAIPLRKKYSKGFTLIEVLMVMVIIGILVTIAFMYILDLRTGSYNATLQSDLRTIYTASTQFHNDHPDDSLTVDDLDDYDYRPSNEKIVITVIDGSETGLLITASHPVTPDIFQVDHAGRVSKQ